MDQAEERWRAFLNNQVPHPASFEQHLLIFDFVEQTDIDDLPPNFNRFMSGAVTLDIVGSERTLMTYAKLGRFSVFGIIQKGPNSWEGTKIHVKHGVLKPNNVKIPLGLLDLFKAKAANIHAAFKNISSHQREKIDANIAQNIEQFSLSDQFESILADARIFGDQAVLWKDK